jgi:hypothetical protein
MTTVITKLNDGDQVQIKGTRPYNQDCRIGTLVGFYKRDGRFDNADELIARDLARGEKPVWINLSAVTLTDDRAYNLEQGAKRDASPHLATGDLVEIEGVVYAITNTNNNNFGLVEVK